MADVAILRATYSGGNPSGVAELQTGETLSITHGGTGAITASAALSSLGAASTSAIQSYTAAQRGAVASLSVASNLVAVDMALANNFSLALQATTGQTLSNPTNLVAGQSGQITINQNATPSSLAFGSYWTPYDGTTPTVSTTASAQNLISYYVTDSTHIWFSLAKHGVV